MKHSFTYFALAISMLAAFSCARKELSTEDTTGLTPLVIKAVVEDDLTKTTYTDNGTKYEFAWNANNLVAVQVYAGGVSTSPDQITFKAQQDGPVSDLVQDGSTFDLTPSHNVDGYTNKNYTLGDYAFYPRYNAGSSGYTWGTFTYYKNGGSTDDYIELKETFPYQSDNPTCVIPIIGKKEVGSDYGTPTATFKFKTATAVLKVSMKQIPAGATKLVLTAGASDALSGEWYLTDETYTNGIVAGTNKKTSTNTKTITFSNLSGKDTFTDFYVPVPEGTLHGLRIDIKKDDNTLLWRVSTDEDITVSRGVVTELPVIDMSGKALTVTVGTNSGDPSIKITNSGYTRVCATVNTTSTNNDKSAYPAGLWFSTGTDYKVSTWDEGHTDLLADKSSGLYYLHYVALSSAIEANTLTDMNDKRVKAYGTIPFYFLAGTDKTAIVGNYVHATDATCKNENSPAEVPVSANITLVASTSPTTSNIMISNVDGVACSLHMPIGIWDGATTITFARSYIFQNNIASDTYLMNYATSNDIVLEFTNAAKSALYVTADQFGLQHWDESWYYVYNAGSSHVYTKE